MAELLPLHDEQVSVCTHSGIQFKPFAWNPGTVTLDDISWSLARICRFNGHTEYFYSVAQHSVLVSELVVHYTPINLLGTGVKLAALMHDAAEAYVGDMAAPVKRMFPAMRDVEDRLTRHVFKELNIAWPTPDGWTAIKEADTVACEIEQRDLMPRADWWAALPHADQPVIEPWPMDYAENRFLKHYIFCGGNVL